MTAARIVHFIGFRGDEYWSAVRAFGRPHFIHRWLDQRAFREIDWQEDLVVLANAERGDVRPFNAPDITGPGYDPIKED